MTVLDLKELYEYGYWANKKLFDVLSRIAPEHFTQSVAGSYGSIRNTLVHAMSTEWGWLSRCGGHPRGEALKADAYPTLESVVEQWSAVEGYIFEFLSKIKDDDLARQVEFLNPRHEKRSMLLGEMMHHSAIHAVHHRGQIALLLRELGYAPGNFDILFYYAAKRGVLAW
jgi:uncharacterized damage-inducible protein DinB